MTSINRLLLKLIMNRLLTNLNYQPSFSDGRGHFGRYFSETFAIFGSSEIKKKNNLEEKTLFWDTWKYLVLFLRSLEDS